RLGFKPNDYVVDPARMIGRMPERVPLVLAAVVHESLGAGATMPALAGRTEFDPGQVYDHLLASWGFLWFAGLAALAMGWRGLMRSPWRELTLPLLLQAAAYTGVILASKWDVSFHLVTTMDRLLLEL